ncbi:MAG TPA: TIGR01777 family oxidoreductase [Solirubrobacteraceae bacterium]|nr:TIGR01777 family oxidoreductase [Solirubrobacteraceae bacterium]
MACTRVTVTGATGLIGPRVVGALQAGKAEVTVLSRDAARASERLAGAGLAPVQAFDWDLMSEPAPVQALHGRDAVVHLAGENIAQRWSERAKRAIRDSRVTGTRNLLAGLEAIDAEQAGQRPGALISSSGVGYYGAHGEEPLDEEAPPGEDFLARICVEWEAQASKASALGMRVALVRTGVVLDRNGGALEKMLPPFRLGVGGPVAGGRQFISWIHLDDLAGLIVAATRDERWSGPLNATAPEPVSNREFSRALGRALKRPALLPVPAAALQALYGEMAEIVTRGARVVPAKALVLGFQFAHAELDEALSSAISG